MLHALFIFQVLCTLIFGGAQFRRLLKSTEGVSAVWFGSWLLFLALNLWLAINAHRVKPSMVTLQVISVYLLWTMVVTADCAALVVSPRWKWKRADTWTTGLVLAGILGTALVAEVQGWSPANPLVKGLLATFLKTVPQLALAYTIYTQGNKGLPGLVLATGHLTILVRLAQLYLSIAAAGWDLNRVGSAISEIGNEASWIVVTIIWMIREINNQRPRGIKEVE